MDYARLHSSYTFIILFAALFGYFLLPIEIYQSTRDFIPLMLALVMLGMGLTITPHQLKALRSAGLFLILGIILQYTIMPLTAFAIAKILNLPPLLILGIILVGSSPGGTASNVITYLARGDVALSITLTTASTLLAPLLTPLWVYLLASQWIPIAPAPLFITITKIILVPVILGILIRIYWHPSKRILNQFLPVFSMLIIAIIVAVVVGLNRTTILSSYLIFIAVAIQFTIGLTAGYFSSNFIQSKQSRAKNKPRSRAVAIEVAMQNSGLAVALALAHFDPLAAVPGAIYSIFHNIAGVILASYWHSQPSKT
ncbi:Sodium Bile acid symporter family protein [Poriferisphaera corsica]|uniref:Sodium Bile acid symporter family protein n=1 Tax=Poriferisphaera corsica TaxID=2528020 RepID=A0A517YP63_9BACT|nr:bile acid:sodium symporter family protein [Poriferisphaera corsica]QDU31999.1 Sodium Bile acid symporter family protein [Poriferisphaera corsica]